jgi:Ca2+-binding EF-hand superfamily protein
VQKQHVILGMVLGGFVSVSTGYAQDYGSQKFEKGYTKDRFEAADTDGDGFLTLKEAGAAAIMYEGAQGQERFKAADTDGDGLLSFQEAAARKARERENLGEAAGAAQKRVYNKERFNGADTNGDGYVSKAEAQADSRTADVLGGARFDAADTDNDGKLSFEEAKARYMLERKKF